MQTTFLEKKNVGINDNIEVEIGDAKQADFFPQIKIKRWDNECNFSCRLINIDTDKPRISFALNKILYKKNKIEAHFYKVEKKIYKENDAKGNEHDVEMNEHGGYEFEIILNEKPATNKVKMSIQTKGLKFLYQPALPHEDLLKGHYRPDNIIGSYAVYHKTKANDYSRVGGNDYKAGKAFHIYRPEIIDKTGKKVWGKLNIDEAKSILTIEIPQEFLNTAIYPIVVDPTFGYDTAGSTFGFWSPDTIRGIYPFSPADGGTIDWIRFYSTANANDAYYRATIYRNSDNILVAVGAEKYVGVHGNRWNQLEISGYVYADVEYILGMWIGIAGDLGIISYDTENNIMARDNRTYQSTGDPPSPNVWSGGKPYGNYKISVYCSYTIAPPPGSPDFTNRKFPYGYLAFGSQFIKHRLNDTTPWASPDGYLLE